MRWWWLLRDALATHLFSVEELPQSRQGLCPVNDVAGGKCCADGDICTGVLWLVYQLDLQCGTHRLLLTLLCGCAALKVQLPTFNVFNFDVSDIGT